MLQHEDRDLTNPDEWAFVQHPPGNPASVYSKSFIPYLSSQADPDIMKDVMHKELSTWPKYEQALKVGFGSVYWMEGVVTRAVDKRGGNGKLLNILRVNNDVFCNLAALIQVDDSDEKNITAEFLRFASIPGLSVSHPAITYDFVTDLYWMVSNTNGIVCAGGTCMQGESHICT